jgi:uncharacterized RDD family membrane protein YckC
MAPQLSSLAAQGSRKMTLDPQLHVPLAGWWRRAGATVIDVIILIVISAVIRFVVNGISGILLSDLVSLLYIVALISSKSGQTLGNRALRSRVRDQMGAERVSVLRALLRWAVDNVPTTVATLVTWSRTQEFVNWSKNHPGISTSTHVPAYISNDIHFVSEILIPIGIFMVIDYLWPLWDRRNRTLHDIVAGTVVSYE